DMRIVINYENSVHSAFQAIRSIGRRFQQVPNA
ncbi:MAG: hypothetical protein ACI9BW_000634, partial [Gammaproteobacteria bacterium]